MKSRQEEEKEQYGKICDAITALVLETVAEMERRNSDPSIDCYLSLDYILEQIEEARRHVRECPES